MLLTILHYNALRCLLYLFFVSNFFNNFKTIQTDIFTKFFILFRNSFASPRAIFKISIVNLNNFFIILSTAHLRLIAVGLEAIKSSLDPFRKDKSLFSIIDKPNHKQRLRQSMERLSPPLF